MTILRAAWFACLVACSTRPAPAPVEGAPSQEPAPVEAGAEGAVRDGLPRGPRAIGSLGEGLAEAEVRGCATDTDCAVSCRNDGTCCFQLCDCTNVYNVSFLSKLEAHQASCTQAGCPVARCMPPKPRVAVCRAGMCELAEALPE